MSASNTEIPGFYRDPETGKYYKDDPGGSSNPVLKKLKKQREGNKEFNTRPKITNVVRYLNAREIKTIGCESKEYLKMRCSLKKETKNIMFKALRGNGNLSVDYLIGSDRKLCTSWFEEKQICNLSKYALATMEYESTYSEDWCVHFTRFSVIDMCEGVINDDFVVLYNHMYYSIPFEITFNANNGAVVESITRGRSWRILSRLDCLHRQMFCCSSNKNRVLYAFGCKNLVGLRHANDMVTFVNIDGKVHTVSFDVTGNLMASGIHTGKLFLHDLRSEEIATSYDISKACLTDSSLLNFPNIVIGGADDVLCSFDTRKNEIVTEYLNHKQAGIKKAPLSIASQMLCARGSDNKIRIWELSTGGLPIHEIRPQKNPDTNIQGWLYSTGNKTQLHFFEGPSKKVFDIMNFDNIALDQ